MNKSVLLGSALALAVAGTPVMAANDFHGLGQVGSLSPMTDEQLSAVEGGLKKYKNHNGNGGNCSGTGNVCLNVSVLAQNNIAVLNKDEVTQINAASVEQSIGP
jgi:hypothetical protein